jgi:hypothetical protein
MILILDDTFVEREADYPTDFLLQEEYKNVINIHTQIKGSEINTFESKITDATCIACHRTIKFYGNSGNVLSQEKNIHFFDKLESFINNSCKPYISFSGSNIHTKLIGENNLAINKRQFYFNLQNFADYLIDNQQVELRTLTYGKNWLGYELSGIQSNIFYILGRHEKYQFLTDFDNIESKLFSELIRFNEVNGLFTSSESWIQYLKTNYNGICFLQSFLEKIVKSYIKYGKYIYNL